MWILKDKYILIFLTFEEYKMKKLLLLIICMFFISCASKPFSNTDKILFSGLIVSQAADGYTTIKHLDNPDNYIENKWNWKYGRNRPSDEQVIITKIVELGIAYYIARNLDDPYRKAFMIGTSLLLLNCAFTNDF